MKRSQEVFFPFIVAAFIFTSNSIGLALDAVKISTAAGGTSPLLLIFPMGEERGFYKEERLKAKLIGTTMQTAIQGLIGGSFDFTQMLGQSSAAILSSLLKTLSITAARFCSSIVRVILVFIPYIITLPLAPDRVTLLLHQLT